MFEVQKKLINNILKEDYSPYSVIFNEDIGKKKLLEIYDK